MKEGVICLGEALVDFIPTDQTNITYEKCPGGAPANVAVGLAKLGVDTAFIGKVGHDGLGFFLKETLKDYGVNISGMFLTDTKKTGLTFVQLEKNGERDFEFYIQPSADQFLEREDIGEAMFQGKKILHIGSISMITEPARSATKKAVQEAKQAGLLISYDPNLRLKLWNRKQEAQATIISMLFETDILKVSQEELTFITDERNIEEGIHSLSKFDIPLIFVTLGAKGCIVSFANRSIQVPSMKVVPVDTTGAGDAFVSGALYGLSQSMKNLRSLNETEVFEITRFANISGALATKEKGAMSALPGLDYIIRNR